MSLKHLLALGLLIFALSAEARPPVPPFVHVDLLDTQNCNIFN